jgi:hypothetical protein
MHGQQNVKRVSYPVTLYLFRSRNHFSVEISAGVLLIITRSEGLFVRDSTDLCVCVFSKETVDCSS